MYKIWFRQLEAKLLSGKTCLNYFCLSLTILKISENDLLLHKGIAYWCQSGKRVVTHGQQQYVVTYFRHKKSLFQVQKSLVEFGGGGGGGGVWHQTPPRPPPPQTLTRKFSKSKRSSWSLGVVVGGVWHQTPPPPPPPPQILTRKFSKSKKLS